MRVRVITSLVFLSLAVPSRAADRPNVLIIIADDIGYSDFGCYGGEMETPNIDRLAAGGLRFTQYHTENMCHPTRASLLTGRYQIRGFRSPDNVTRSPRQPSYAESRRGPHLGYVRSWGISRP